MNLPVRIYNKTAAAELFANRVDVLPTLFRYEFIINLFVRASFASGTYIKPLTAPTPNAAIYAGPTRWPNC